MAVGQGALVGGDSYLSFGRETTWGTGVTCTSLLEFGSCSLKTSKEFKVIEQIETSRTRTQGFTSMKKVEGEVEFYYSPLIPAANYILQNAMGGTVTSGAAAGDTVGAATYTHTFAIGSMDQQYKALSANVRRGDTTSGKVMEYVGLRVDELTISAELEDALKVSVAFIGKDSTVTTNNVGAALTSAAAPFLTFASGRFSVEGTFASCTSSSFWHVQKFEFSLKNNLSADNESRRIGSDVLSVLPPGMAEMELKCSIRFDTTTAYDAMIAATQLGAQAEFLGPTLTGSKLPARLTLNFPKVYISDAGEPEISDASGILTSEVTFKVLRDGSSATGYACQAIVTNLATSYA